MPVVGQPLASLSVAARASSSRPRDSVSMTRRRRRLARVANRRRRRRRRRRAHARPPAWRPRRRLAARRRVAHERRVNVTVGHTRVALLECESSSLLLPLGVASRHRLTASVKQPARVQLVASSSSSHQLNITLTVRRAHPARVDSPSLLPSRDHSTSPSSSHSRRQPARRLWSRAPASRRLVARRLALPRARARSPRRRSM